MRSFGDVVAADLRATGGELAGHGACGICPQVVWPDGETSVMHLPPCRCAS